MQTKDELIKEIAYRLRLETIDPNDRDPARTFYDRIAEVATRELRIRCEEMVEFINAVADDSVRACAFCVNRGNIGHCSESVSKCADYIKAYIEARVKERMGKDAV